jgi:hypothetical protein
MRPFRTSALAAALTSGIMGACSAWAQIEEVPAEADLRAKLDQEIDIAAGTRLSPGQRSEKL